MPTSPEAPFKYLFDRSHRLAPCGQRQSYMTEEAALARWSIEIDR